MRRACAGCDTPLDGLGAITGKAKVSHGFCTVCVTKEHTRIDEIPACGLVGKWGECNLFDGHVGPCKHLGEDVSYRMIGAEHGPGCQLERRMR
jgi:hypothetical protein